MNYHPEVDHGKIVWAKIKARDKSWAAMIISTKKLDLVFEESNNFLWVWWLVDNRFSKVSKKFIEDFIDNFEIHVKNISGIQEKGVLLALDIISKQYGLLIPNNSIDWAIINLKQQTKNLIGKFQRNTSYYIPNDILKEMKSVNDKNIHKNLSETVINDFKQHNKHNKNKKTNVIIDFKNAIMNYCLCCKSPLDEDKNDHPLFYGSMCHNCEQHAKNILMPISEKDLNNDGCCICFTIGDLLIFCDHCIRSFCRKCINLYSTEKCSAKIFAQKNWECFLCEESHNPSFMLQSRTIRDQLENIYSLYSTFPYFKNIVKTQKLYVLSINDKEAMVAKMLNSLQFPLELIELKKSLITDINSLKDKVILLVNFCKKTDTEEILEAFTNLYNFFLKLREVNPRKILWAFETRASLNEKEQNFISRFCEKQPYLIGTDDQNILLKSRFLWTNIKINNFDLRKFQKSNIFIKKDINDMGQDITDTDSSLFYNSVSLMVTSMLKNNIKQIK